MRKILSKVCAISIVTSLAGPMMLNGISIVAETVENNTHINNNSELSSQSLESSTNELTNGTSSSSESNEELPVEETEENSTISESSTENESSFQETQSSETSENTIESSAESTSEEEKVQESSTEETLESEKTIYSVNDIVNSAPRGMRIQNILQTPSITKNGFTNQAEVVTNTGTNTDVVFITKDMQNQLGILWSDKNYKMDITKDFEIEMKMFFGNDGDNASDGMTFTIHNPGSDPSAYDDNGQAIVSGDAGGSLGVMGRSDKKSDKPWEMAVKNSFTIEFDTHVNESGLDRGIYGNHKKNGFHVANYYPGEYSSYETGRRIVPALYHNDPIYYRKGSSPSNNLWHDFSVKYIAEQQQIIYIFDGAVRTAKLDLSKLDLNSAEKNSLLFWGFTGSTGDKSSPQALVFTKVTDFGNESTQLEIETNTPDIFLGTKNKELDPKDFIETVKFGDKEISKEDYYVEFIEEPDTSEIGTSSTNLKVTLKDNTTKTEVISSEANIVWGNSIVSLSDDLNKSDLSISLLKDKNNVPYLNANKGKGFSTNPLSSDLYFSIYRTNMANNLLSINGHSGNSQDELANTLNKSFDELSIQYGDVIAYSTEKNLENQKGKNTWVSRNNELVKETEGYKEALYEISKEGYRLLHVNQFRIEDNINLNYGISEEEFIKKMVVFPSTVEEKEDFSFNYVKSSGESTGPQEGVITITEKLVSGGTFSMDYPVKFTINSRIYEWSTEMDNNKNILSEEKITDFEYDIFYTPMPEKYIEKDGELYKYKGYIDNENEFHEELPIPVKNGLFKYEYKYEKADKYINITIPTEIVFGTFDNTEEIISNKYEIKNNSKDLAASVSLDSFNRVRSAVRLLSNGDEPDKKIDSARLNLLIDDEPLINGLNETIFDTQLADIEPEGKIRLELAGEYYNKTSKTNIVEYQTKLKFRAISEK
ncbi:L-type lectin-domain containing protein [Enterococcus thailandicus]|uniref:L-type lectin-domain containing protein n=1 Tax=Enterococcus thailandicus TaxID=417368 RepID=UPI0022EBF98D|nr:L-type lectin-domain containing protein [Enterococcus thailandicus]MDA3973007.1 L-type lectin-domain containing protein [Enterococcus thailandicus]MDA3980467.1 L-type lectin-domain containing protein [Enterococcus thailandicus]